MKKSFFAKEIQRQLDHKCYHPIWHMMHKIRSAMGEREGEYMLAGRVELDDGCFFTEVFENEKDNLKSATINELVKTLASRLTAVDTDDSTSYVDLKNFVPKHNS